MKILGKNITKKTVAIFIIVNILTSLIGIIVGIIFGEQIQEFIIGKPEININFVTIEAANITSFSKEFGNNFSLVYQGGLGYSQILILNNKNASDYILTNTFEPTDCASCTFYSFNFINNGNLDADSIVFDLTSSEDVKIIKDNQKVIEKNCGGSFESKGCHFKIENLLKGQSVVLVLETVKSTNFNINCKANNKEKYCNTKYAHVFTQSIPEGSTLMMNSKIIEIPYIKNNDTINLFYFNTSSWSWTFFGTAETSISNS